MTSIEESVGLRRIARLSNCCRNTEDRRQSKPDGEVISVAFLILSSEARSSRCASRFPSANVC